MPLYWPEVLGLYSTSYSKLVGTADTAAAAPAKSPFASSVRPSATRARFCWLEEPAAVASVIAVLKRFVALSSIAAVVMPGPSVSWPFRSVVLNGTPEQKVSAKNRYEYPA